MHIYRASPSSILFHVALILTSTLTIRCASDSSGGEQGEVVQGESDQKGQNDQGSNASLNGDAVGKESAAQGESMNNAVEGGSTENFGAGNGGTPGNGGASPTGSNADPALGEGMNNVPLENPTALGATGNPALNPAAPLNQTTPLNATATATPATETPPSNVAEPASAAIPQTTDTPATGKNPAASGGESVDRAAASPFQNPHMNWPGKGKVKYVTRQLTRHSSPNGPVVGEFEEGEHPLVFQNGNWAELNDGSFVKGNGLSEKGVGYNKGKSQWQK